MWSCQGTHSRVTGISPLCVSVRREELPAILDSNAQDLRPGLPSFAPFGSSLFAVDPTRRPGQKNLAKEEILRGNPIKRVASGGFLDADGDPETGGGCHPHEQIEAESVDLAAHQIGDARLGDTEQFRRLGLREALALDTTLEGNHERRTKFEVLCHCGIVLDGVPDILVDFALSLHVASIQNFA